MNWAECIAFDVETSGTLREYSLQPWRVKQKKAWLTSAVGVGRYGGETYTVGKIDPTAAELRGMFNEIVSRNQTVVTWNGAFDISWLLAYGLEDIVYKARWIDGLLLWRHATIEPEYETDRSKKKSYSLKACVAELWPEHAGYEQEINFHDPSPEARERLHKYNIKDCAFTLHAAEHWWNQLTERQQQAALIEAECLPMVAQANLEGLLIDPLAARELEADLTRVADERLAELSEHGVTEQVVRSPTQLGKLMYDDWGLKVLKENTGKKTGKVSRATDKEVLHELSFEDPRARSLKEYREALGNRTKFATTPLVAAEYNGDYHAHSLANVFGTYCVPGDVEVLTRKGWQRLDKWDGGEIAQVHSVDRMIEFLPAERFVGPEVRSWIHVKQRAFDCMFTPGHTVPYLAQKTFAWKTVQAGHLLRGEQRSIPVAGTWMKFDGQYSEDQMRLFAAVQADGYSTPKHLKFMFKKQRKIDRLVYLLNKLNIRYRRYVCEAYPDRTEIIIAKSYRPDWLGHDKKFLGPWLLDANFSGLSAFLCEVEHWDGSPHRDAGSKYTSKIKENVEWVVTVAALVSRKASIHARSHGMWGCHMSEQDVLPCKTVRPEYVSEIIAPQMAYCATTRTAFWLARSNGHIFVTGNTGRLTYSSKQLERKRRVKKEPDDATQEPEDIAEHD